MSASCPVLRGNLGNTVTREFCAECGTHIITRPTSVPGVVLKVGTLDDPTLFGTALHRRRAGLPSDPRRYAGFRTAAAAVAQGKTFRRSGQSNLAWPRRTPGHKHGFAISPPETCELLPSTSPSPIRGRGECRAPDAPAASCALGGGEYAHEYSQRVTGITGIPRAMVYGLYRALPGDRPSCHRRRRKSADLTPAPRRQDHTSSPSALASLVKRAVASTASRPASVTFAKRPYEWGGTATDIDLIWGDGEANYFFNEDWTGQITLSAFRKSVFARWAFSTKLLCRKADRTTFPAPSGKSANRDAKGVTP